jgi:hypothetical protein
MGCQHLDETWDRIEAANAAAGMFTDWSAAERDQIEAWADDLNDELLHPKPALWSVIHQHEAPHRQHMRDVARRAEVLRWTRLSNRSCPRRLVGKRCKFEKCWCGSARSGDRWRFRALNDHGATWHCKRTERQFVLWEPYQELNVGDLLELTRVAEQDGLQVRLTDSVWHPPLTFGIMFFPKDRPPA